jgi:glycine/D-amino acid oxidase-like deaminating enzyme
MIQAEFLIVGQGISGTFLSWYLQKAKRSFVVVDYFEPNSSSRVAAGIINPVTGRRIVKTWMIETLLPFALNAYREFGLNLGISAISRKKMIDFFPTPQMLNAFRERANEDDEYLSLPKNADLFHKHFNYDFGFGEIDPCYVVNLSELLFTWREELTRNNLLLTEKFSHDHLSVDTAGIRYKNVSAEKIIFCDGIYSSANKYFSKLPFALNKGEALVIQTDDIPESNIYKKGIMLSPLGDNLFWAGSSHEWNFTDNLPSEIFLQRTTKALMEWLKQPFKVINHVASIRPATVERRPFVGMHPHFPAIGILNGMGTKGCSLSPYFASELVNHLTENTPILPEADISRFSRILNTSN